MTRGTWISTTGAVPPEDPRGPDDPINGYISSLSCDSCNLPIFNLDDNKNTTQSTTMVSVSSVRRKPKTGRSGVMDGVGFGPEIKARFFLFVACLWPLWVMALYGASAPQVDSEGANNGSRMMKLRSVLDRVDIMGYGPTHPRVAVVLVGDTRESIIASVESVYKTTDLNRIFLICAVLDGHEEDATLLSELARIEQGSVPHWHGLRPDNHAAQSTNKDGEDVHTKKIHVLFNPTKLGVAASRLDAAEFIQLLQGKHEAAGLKSTQEDLILLLLQGGAELTDTKWLPATTSSLIVPPPLLNVGEEAGEENIAMKLANAVSLRSEGMGYSTCFDEHFEKIEKEVSRSGLQPFSGDSYPTPALNGGAIALRLGTFLNLPVQDPYLKDNWSANLDLALNLWLCGDGIDIVQDAVVALPKVPPIAKIQPELAARFAAVWMDDQLAQKFLHWYSPTTKSLDWETKLTNARHFPTFPKGIQNRCRPFSWYIEEVNPDLRKILTEEPPKSEEDESSDESSSEDAQAVAKEMGKLKKGSSEIEEEHHEPPVSGKEKYMAGGDTRRKPSKPLRKENLEIVQKAKQIDISFVDVSGGHKEHPHMGAKDEEGKWGYIHDEAALHKNPPSFEWNDDSEEEACSSRDNNWKMLTKRVKVEMEYDKQQDKSGAKRDKIFCLVYTIEKGHDKIPPIRETWGSKCDGFMVGSTKTNTSLGTVEIPHEGEEEYNNIWQKVRSMWSYIYDNYYEKYDWFHIGGDDLFMLIENLRYYLESEEIRTAANGGIYLPRGNETMQTPLLLGRRFAYMGDMTNIFDSGGSGYTMNKAALKRLVVDGFPNYFPHMHTFSEDTMVARVFRKMDVLPYDTKDEDGGERYMPFMPGHHWGYHLPKNPEKDWYAKYSINIKEGPEHCSPQSVAFHYVKTGANMKRFFALAYDLCPKEYK
eukprot:scaffold1184_cov132-Cylindrotheca_fusiformis.AAC.10